jgi:hypothetical protein
MSFTATFVLWQNYPLAGLQSTHMCYCGGKADTFENISRLGRSPDCTNQCFGNNQEVCGGTDAMSIYLTNVRNYKIEREYSPNARETTLLCLVYSIPNMIKRCNAD